MNRFVRPGPSSFRRTTDEPGKTVGRVLRRSSGHHARNVVPGSAIEHRLGDGVGVAGGVLDAEPEQVDEPARVAGGRDRLLEDPVGADGLGAASQAESQEYPAVPDGSVASGRAEVD